MKPNETIESSGYKILRRVATGGTAEVFLAENADGEKVALKLILPHIATQRDFSNMFLDEIEIVKRLENPHIVKYIDNGEHNGRIFILLEWVEGASLQRAIKQCAPPPPFALFAICEGLLKALECVKNATDENGAPLEIVHRDICPQNILVSKTGVVKIADFGIASAKKRITYTKTGEIKGRFEFMSPEQAGGKKVDIASDLFSCGKTLEKVCGKTELNNFFAEILRKLTEPEKKKRYSSPLDALNDLYKIKPHPSYKNGILEIANWTKNLKPDREEAPTPTPIM